jgi:hypothetical protein
MARPPRSSILRLDANPFPQEMKMSFGQRARLGLCATAVALLALPAAAGAKAPTYKVSIKGNQVSTWNQSHTPTFPCDATVTGAGSQDIPIITDKPLKLQLLRPKRMPALLAAPGDEGAKYGFAQPIPVSVNAEREGYQNIQAPGGECNGDGGWDGQPIARDCGLRFGWLDLTIGYAHPLGGTLGKNTRDVLKVSGHYSDFEPVVPLVPGRWEGDPMGHTFENCPYWPAGSASAIDDLILTGEKLPAAKLARLKPGKTIKLSGGEQEPETNDDFTGETTIAWNMKIKRVG